jgi:hypothetical protein
MWARYQYDPKETDIDQWLLGLHKRFRFLEEAEPKTQ